jgi:hypothetical protein
MSGSVASLPASINPTVTCEFCESREASTHPADPAPIITISKLINGPGAKVFFFFFSKK